MGEDFPDSFLLSKIGMHGVKKLKPVEKMKYKIRFFDHAISSCSLK